jgi:teichuronic acid biosynthesis glycosyltransferase TuaC
MRDGTDSPLRILSLSSVFPNPDEPGLGVFVRSRLQHMAQAGAEIVVIAPVPVLDYSRVDWHKGQWGWIGSRDIPENRSDGRLKVTHPRWFYPPFGGALNACFQFLQLRSLICRLAETFRFRVIDAHFGYPEGIAAAMLAERIGVPFSITLRGNETAHSEHPLKRRWMARAFRKAGRIIAVSETLHQFAIDQGASPRRVKTIPNGIDAGVFRPYDRTAARLKFGFPMDRKIILSVGTLIERKGHHRAVAALRFLHEQQRLPAMLVIAGGPGREGDYEARIRSCVAEMRLTESVKLLGHVRSEDLPELMSAADVLCLASTREGWPNVVHEALGCGTPVVATNVGGVPDMIPTEEHGIVVPVENQTALEEALHKALNRSWDHASISTRARSRSWGQVADEVLSEMQAIIAEYPHDKENA